MYNVLPIYATYAYTYLYMYIWMYIHMCIFFSVIRCVKALCWLFWYFKLHFISLSCVCVCVCMYANKFVFAHAYLIVFYIVVCLVYCFFCYFVNWNCRSLRYSNGKLKNIFLLISNVGKFYQVIKQKFTNKIKLINLQLFCCKILKQFQKIWKFFLGAFWISLINAKLFYSEHKTCV